MFSRICPFGPQLVATGLWPKVTFSSIQPQNFAQPKRITQLQPQASQSPKCRRGESVMLLPRKGLVQECFKKRIERKQKVWLPEVFKPTSNGSLGDQACTTTTTQQQPALIQSIKFLFCNYYPPRSSVTYTVS